MKAVYADTTQEQARAVAQANAAIELGREYLYSHDYPAAYEYFKTTIERFPHDARLYYWLTISAERAATTAALETFLNASLDTTYNGKLQANLSRYALAIIALSKNDAASAQALLEPAIEGMQNAANAQAIDNSGATVMVLLATIQFHQGDRASAEASLKRLLQLAQRPREVDTGVCFHHAMPPQTMAYLSRSEWDARSPEQDTLDLLTRCESAWPEAWRLWNVLDAMTFLDAYHEKRLSPSQVAKDTVLKNWDAAWLNIAEYAVFHGNKHTLIIFDALIEKSETRIQQLLPKNKPSLLSRLENLSTNLQSTWKANVKKPAGNDYILRRQHLLVVTKHLLAWAKARNTVAANALFQKIALATREWPEKDDQAALASMLSLAARVAIREGNAVATNRSLSLLAKSLREMKRPVPLLSVLKTLTLNAYKAGEKGRASDYLRALQYTLIDNKLIKRQRPDFLVKFPSWLAIVCLSVFVLLLFFMSLVSLRHLRRMKVRQRGWRFASRIWVQAMIVSGRAMAKVNKRWSIIFAIAAVIYIAVLWLLYAFSPSTYQTVYPFTGVWPNSYLWLTILFLYICVAYIRVNIRSRYAVAADIDQRLKTRGLHEAWMVSDDHDQSSLLGQKMAATLAEPSTEKYWAVDADTVISIVAVLVMLGALLSLNQLPAPEMQRPIIPEFDECNKLQPPPKKETPPEKPLELQRLQRSKRQGSDGARGRTGLDVNVQPVPEAMVSKLSETTSVGGLDVKGEVYDYYTNFPERDWRYPREDVAPSTTEQEAPSAEFEAIKHEPIQYIPARYKGRWQEYQQEDSP